MSICRPITKSPVRENESPFACTPPNQSLLFSSRGDTDGPLSFLTLKAWHLFICNPNPLIALWFVVVCLNASLRQTKNCSTLRCLIMLFIIKKIHVLCNNCSKPERWKWKKYGDNATRGCAERA